MAELLLGLLIVVVFIFLIRYIINEKPEGNWDSPILPAESESAQVAKAEEPMDTENTLDDGTGSAP